MCLAVPGKITNIAQTKVSAERLADVDFQGSSMQISLDFLPDAQVGDWVLVHAGYAINTLDEQEAREVWEYLREFEQVSAEAAQEFHGKDSPDEQQS